METAFRDRSEAGRALADLLKQYRGDTSALVLALPRGGVPVGYEVASHLGVPLDVFVVRKLGVPGREELAMGAIASGGVRVLNDDVVRHLAISPGIIDAVAERESREIERREREYRGDRPRPDVRGRLVILVDDGLATGSTMKAAVIALRRQDPRSIVVAVPVAAASTRDEFRSLADHVVCARSPEDFSAVSDWYDDFSQTSDGEVRSLLALALADAAREPR
ncbi:MAG: phosphoribosyltransferase family protein [Bryobacteraceae bacterium]|jgi:predicted phosphoribosyltransferase